MKKKDIDPNEQLDFAVSELQVAIEKVKQSRSQEIKIWQQRTFELQNQVQTLQSQLTESVNLNAHLQSNLQELTSECNRLRAINQSLNKTLQEKEIDISRFNALNESLRTLLDGPQSVFKPTNQSPIRTTQQFSYQNERKGCRW